MRPRGVLVIGAGGLGCAALIRLSESGVERIGIAEFDRVEESNLPRQVLYSDADIGRPKIEAAIEKLRRFPGGSGLQIDSYPMIIKGDEGFLAEYSIVIDATDRADVKLSLHDRIVARRIPLIHSASSGWVGQVLTVAGSGCMRCLFGSDSSYLDAPDCSRAGAVGPIVGLVGNLAAMEAMRILYGEAPQWSRTFWQIDAKTGVERSVRIEPEPDCVVCSTYSSEEAK